RSHVCSMSLIRDVASVVTYFFSAPFSAVVARCPLFLHRTASPPAEPLDVQPPTDRPVPLDFQPLALQRGTQQLPDLDALRIVPPEVPEAEVHAAPVQRALLVLRGVEAVAGVLRFLAAGFAVGLLDLFQPVRLREPGHVQGDDPLPFEGVKRALEAV